MSTARLLRNSEHSNPGDEELEELRWGWLRQCAYASGHVLNDLTASCWFTYLLLYLTQVRVLRSAGVARRYATMLFAARAARSGLTFFSPPPHAPHRCASSPRATQGPSCWQASWQTRPRRRSLAC